MTQEAAQTTQTTQPCFTATADRPLCQAQAAPSPSTTGPEGRGQPPPRGAIPSWALPAPDRADG